MERCDNFRNVKVGIATVLSLVLLLVSYWVVGSLKLNARTYSIKIIFNQIAGVEPGTAVMLAGVKIGFVDKISLTPDNRAQVDVRIRETYRIPENSSARISSVSLLGDKYLEIIPGQNISSKIKDGAVITGSPSYTIDDLLPKVSGILDQVDKVGRSLESWIGDAEIKAHFKSTVRNLDVASENAALLVEDMRRITRSKQNEIDVIAKNFVTASSSMAAVGKDIEELVAGVDGKDISAIVTQLRQATASLNQVSEHAASLVSDPQLQEDIKATVRNSRGATESAKESLDKLTSVIDDTGQVVRKTDAVMDRVAQLVGVRRPSTTQSRPAMLVPPLGYGASFDILYRDMGNIRVDANYTAPFGSDMLIRAGLYDLGETNKLNLQIGKIRSSKETFRIGLYQSKLGLGYDWQVSSKIALQFDGYHPNEPRLDIKGRFPFRQDLFGWAGAENIGGTVRPAIGLQLRF